MLSSILNNDSDSSGDTSDTNAALLKMQSMLKKMADAGDMAEGNAQAMLQSAFGKDADASGDNSDVATLIQTMQNMLQAMNNASDTGDEH